MLTLDVFPASVLDLASGSRGEHTRPVLVAFRLIVCRSRASRVHQILYTKDEESASPCQTADSLRSVPHINVRVLYSCAPHPANHSQHYPSMS